jgi:hypothetical protein
VGVAITHFWPITTHRVLWPRPPVGRASGRPTIHNVSTLAVGCAVMKHDRQPALWFLIAALVAILITGFCLSLTHREARPADNSSPADGGESQPRQ